ncbi:Uncharacterized protein TPAR_01617 [Tolypocladium paradoxum]|uniref:Major facilitator superfamily (MFS) profile domain-containing protein n=1 Tax=Tolypocladium paradoxum TaxID=94208 RepID=A0A2S4L701_9HYPO|nr:Uncharacterized protein TPAR_01617 [Tolypocladium paradoxum]
MAPESSTVGIRPAPALGSNSDNTLEYEKQDEQRSAALTAEKSTLPDGYYMSPRFIGTFGGIAFTLAATYFAFAAAAGCIVEINQDIGPSENYYLFSIVWTIAQSISILIFGRNSDTFGRRNWALGASCLGIIGGILAATCQTIEQLIGAFVILGLAAGIPGSYPLLTGELLTNKLKFLGTIIVVIPNIIATGFGPYLGVRLSVIASWRWIFYIYIILMVCGTVLWYFFYHPPSFTQLHGTKVSRLQELAHIDYIGTFLLVAGLVLFLLGVSWGGPYSWSSARVLGLLITGAGVLVIFVLYETYAKIRHPIFPMHFFRDVRGFTCVVIISAITGCLQTAAFILWPSQVLYIFGSTTEGWETVAWMSSVVNFGAWAGIIVIGPLYHIIKHLRTQLLVGSIFMTAFLGAMASINYTNKSSAIAFAFLSTFPMGWGEIFTMLMVQYIVPETSLGVGFAIVSSMRTILGSMFSSIFVAIYTNKLPIKFAEIVVPAVTKAGLAESEVPALLKAVSTASQATIKAIPGMTDELLRITNISVAEAYGQSYAYVYYTAVALGGICIIAAASLRDFDHYLTDHVSRQVYKKEDTKFDILERLAERKETPRDERLESV